MNFENYQYLEFARSADGVLTVALDRPDVLNAINATLHTELAQVFYHIASDESVKTVVLTGKGRAFCGGGDLSWFLNITPEERDRLFMEARKIVLDLLELPQPIIAAVNGAAAGLGCTLALCCDTVFASDAAKLSDPHVKVGVAAGDGGAVIWPWLVGPARAKQYLMTGDAITSVEAERIGLINKVVPAAEVLEQAQAFATRLANGPLQAIRATKHSVNKVLRDTANLVLDTSLALEKENFMSNDHREAIEAFAAGRQPVYTGT